MFLNFIFLTLAIGLAVFLLPGVNIKKPLMLFGVAALFGALNFLTHIILGFLFDIVKILTLGLASLVVNAILLWVTDKFMDSFEIKDGLSLALATVVITVTTTLLKMVLG